MEALFTHVRDETVELDRSVRARRPLLSVGIRSAAVRSQNPGLSPTVLFRSARLSTASGTIRLPNALPMRPASRHPPHDAHFRCHVSPSTSVITPTRSPQNTFSALTPTPGRVRPLPALHTGLPYLPRTSRDLSLATALAASLFACCGLLQTRPNCSL